MTDNKNRIYAAALLNRAGVDFDAQDVGVAAKIVEAVEADVGALLKRYAKEVDHFHSVGGGFVRTAAQLIDAGSYRPAAEAKGPAQ